MTKQARSLWMAAALVLGLGMGFTAGARPESRQPPSSGPVECLRDSECDAACGGPGTGACEFGHCYCIM